MTATEDGRIPPALRGNQLGHNSPHTGQHTRCVPQTQLDLLVVNIDIVHVVLEHCRLAVGPSAHWTVWWVVRRTRPD